MYKTFKHPYEDKTIGVLRLTDRTSIPFSIENTDYQTFKKEVNEGAELQDADGNVMSAEDAKAFIASLPSEQGAV